MTQPQTLSGIVYWFRSDLRLHDNPALQQAIALTEKHRTWLLPVYVHDTALQLTSPWGFVRTSAHRLAWRAMAAQDVSEQLITLGSQLLRLTGEPSEVLAKLMTRLGASTLMCEDIAAPYEEVHIQALQQRGIDVQTLWQSTLMAPDQLPFEPHDVPDEFSSFRRAVERQTFAPAQPVATVTKMPALPDQAAMDSVREMQHAIEHTTEPLAILNDPRSSFPWEQPEFHGGERTALLHLAQYCSRDLPHTYKSTRNGLVGADYSTKWSPWLATGALSARQAWLPSVVSRHNTGLLTARIGLASNYCGATTFVGFTSNTVSACIGSAAYPTRHCQRAPTTHVALNIGAQAVPVTPSLTRACANSTPRAIRPTACGKTWLVF